MQGFIVFVVILLLLAVSGAARKLNVNIFIKKVGKF